MKAVVLEIRDKKAAVMTSDGNVTLIDNADYIIGQEITVRAGDTKIVRITERIGRYIPAAAAAVLLIISLVSGVRVNNCDKDNKDCIGSEEAGKVHSDEEMTAKDAEDIQEDKLAESEDDKTVVAAPTDIVKESNEMIADKQEEPEEDEAEPTSTPVKKNTDKKAPVKEVMASDTVAPTPVVNNAVASGSNSATGSSGSNDSDNNTNNPPVVNNGGGKKPAVKKLVEETAEAAPADPTVVPADPTIVPADPAVTPTVTPADPAVTPTVTPADPAVTPADPAVTPTVTPTEPSPADPAVQPTDPVDPGTVVPDSGSQVPDSSENTQQD